MAIFYSVQDLKAIRNVYASLGLSNSAVLDQIKMAITSNHFDAEAIEEISEVIGDYQKAMNLLEQDRDENGSAIDFALSHAIVTTKRLAEIHMKAQKREEVRV